MRGSRLGCPWPHLRPLRDETAHEGFAQRVSGKLRGGEHDAFAHAAPEPHDEALCLEPVEEARDLRLRVAAERDEVALGHLAAPLEEEVVEAALVLVEEPERSRVDGGRRVRGCRGRVGFGPRRRDRWGRGGRRLRRGGGLRRGGEAPGGAGRRSRMRRPTTTSTARRATRRTKKAPMRAIIQAIEPCIIAGTPAWRA